MGFFDIFGKKENKTNIGSNDKENKKRIQELFKYCSHNEFSING